MHVDHLAVIFPETGNTNFETTRLPRLIEVAASVNIEIVRLPVNPFDALDESHEDVIVESLSHLDCVHIFWMRSISLILDQLRIIKKLENLGVSVYNYLSMGDEYNMATTDIVVNSLFYEQVIIYNEDVFRELRLGESDSFLNWPVVATHKLPECKLAHEKSVTFCFIGSSYRTRIRDILRLVDSNPTRDFYVAGRGWGNEKGRSNVTVSEFISTEQYWKELTRAKFGLVLNRDDADCFHVTSKLIDTVASKAVPVWDQCDPELKKISLLTNLPLLNFNEHGEIFPKYEFEKLLNDDTYYDEYIQKLSSHIINFDEYSVKVNSFLLKLKQNVSKIPNSRLVIGALASSRGRFTFFVRASSFKLSNKVYLPCRLLGVKLPTSLLMYELSIDDSQKRNGVLMVSGIEILSILRSCRWAVSIRSYIRKRIYSWV